MDDDMHDLDVTASLWMKIKFYIFIKLGLNIWQYVIFHEDYWKKPYGITFTGRRDFIKKLKYDLSDIDDDLEVEIKNKGGK